VGAVVDDTTVVDGTAIGASVELASTTLWTMINPNAIAAPDAARLFRMRSTNTANLLYKLQNLHSADCRPLNVSC